MKIKDFKTFIIGNPPPSFGGKYWIFLKLTTDMGIVGFGEAYAIPFHPNVAVKMIEDVCERYVVNENPFQIEKLWRKIYSSGYTQRPDISISGVLSAIEIALWDIVGKEVNQPIYNLLGGKINDRLRTYTYLYPKPEDKSDVYQDADLAAQRALEYQALGFDAVKFDPIGRYTINDPRDLTLEELDHAENFVRAIRTAVGKSCDILFGSHGQMTPASAIRLAKRIEKFDPMWLEEPTPPANITAMASIAKKINIPVATGERLTTKYEFIALLKEEAASIIQMNLGRVGGILEAKKIAAIAEASYAQVAPHMYCGPIIAAANVQVAASISNFLIIEGIETWSGFDASLIIDPLKWEDGYIVPSDKPGLGIEINENKLEEYPYNESKLHLEMSD
jgi:2-dehydro-3-deoxyphosphogalactonate aldolase